MKVIICSDFINETLEISICNIPQLVNYLEENRIDLYNYLMNNDCKWILIDSTGVLGEVFLSPEVINSDIDNYDTLLIGKDLIGNALMTSTVVMYAIVMVLSIALSFTLRTLMAPDSTFTGDGAVQRKKLLLNGLPVITEQGGPVPIIFGECFFGAVKVGQNVDTMDIEVSGQGGDIDPHIPEIAITTIKDHGDGHWYRVV